VNESVYKIEFSQSAFLLTPIAWQARVSNPGVAYYAGEEFKPFITVSYVGGESSTAKHFEEIIEPHRNANEVIWYDFVLF
jgi:hypothetical protein